jgi:nucleotide-binding universal stress UspA family protein
MYRRILVPIDGSETAERGLDEAIRLAADQAATLRVVHVVSDAYVNAMLTGGIESEDLLQDIRTAADSMLQDAAQRARAAQVPVQTELLEHHGARVGERLIDAARQWQADLIVMGTHGRRGLASAALGSDAQYVVRHSGLPVLLLRA